MNPAWQGARNVLCVRLDNLGDVLMTTPAIRALKQALPGRRITLLTSRAAALVAPYVPDVDETVIYDAPWVKHDEAPAPDADAAFLRTIRARRHEAAVIFTVYSQSALPAALFCRLAGIPLRLAHCRENPYHLLTDWVPDGEPHRGVRHEVQRQLDLVGAIGARAADDRLVFRVPRADARRALEKLQAAGIDPGLPLLVMHPGASAASRRYPPESFAAVASSLAARPGCQLLYTGSAGETGLVERIRQAAGMAGRSLAGALSLGELAAVIGLARLIISNNTGPVHLAAAVGTPVVDLYALTNPQHGPWRVPHRMLYRDVPCKYCYRSVCPEGHHDCLRRVHPDEVVAAALELLGEAAAPRSRAPRPVPALAGV